MATWNPWHGCHKLSEGCRNCYVYRMDAKYEKESSIVTKTSNYNLPVKKNRKKEYKLKIDDYVYTCLTSDFFIEEADNWRIDAWNMISLRNNLNFFIISKRIDRFRVNLPLDWGEGYDNVTVCCTCENQEMADYRLPIFLDLPIKHKRIICEPLLEKINISQYLNSSIECVSVGGESGEDARICNFDWILDIRNQCIENNVNFNFHQTGAKFMKDGKSYNIKRELQMKQAKKANIDV